MANLTDLEGSSQTLSDVGGKSTSLSDTGGVSSDLGDLKSTFSWFYCNYLIWCDTRAWCTMINPTRNMAGVANTLTDING